MIANSVFLVLTPFETQVHKFGRPFPICEKEHLFEIIEVKDENIEFQNW